MNRIIKSVLTTLVVIALLCSLCLDSEWRGFWYIGLAAELLIIPLAIWLTREGKREEQIIE